MNFYFDSVEYSFGSAELSFHAEEVLPSPKVLSLHLAPVCERVPISDQPEWIRSIASPSKPWRESKSSQRLSRFLYKSSQRKLLSQRSLFPFRGIKGTLRETLVRRSQILIRRSQMNIRRSQTEISLWYQYVSQFQI